MPKPPVSTQFKKGHSGNPGGRPKVPEALRGVAELSPTEIKRIIAKYARFTKDELQALLKRTDVPVIEMHVASILAHGVRHGDYARLGFLLDRTIGKVVETATEPVSEEQQDQSVRGPWDLKTPGA